MQAVRIVAEIRIDLKRVIRCLADVSVVIPGGIVRGFMIIPRVKFHGRLQRCVRPISSIECSKVFDAECDKDNATGGRVTGRHRQPTNAGRRAEQVELEGVFSDRLSEYGRAGIQHIRRGPAFGKNSCRQTVSRHKSTRTDPTAYTGKAHQK